MTIEGDLAHEIIKYEENGFDRAKCVNPECELIGAPGFVDKVARTSDCPYDSSNETEEERMYADFVVTVIGADDEVIRTETERDTGAVNIENLRRMVLMSDIESIRIEPIAFRVRRGDDKITEWERTDKSI